MLAGTVVGFVFFVASPQGVVRVVVGVTCIILLVSALTGWSLLYFVLHTSTRSDKDAKPLEPS